MPEIEFAPVKQPLQDTSPVSLDGLNFSNISAPDRIFAASEPSSSSKNGTDAGQQSQFANSQQDADSLRLSITDEAYPALVPSVLTGSPLTKSPLSDTPTFTEIVAAAGTVPHFETPTIELDFSSRKSSGTSLDGSLDDLTRCNFGSGASIFRESAFLREARNLEKNSRTETSTSSSLTLAA